MDIRPAATEDERRACWPVMRELRPHLDEASFLAQVARQQANHGYALVALHADGRVRAVAGYRVGEFLAWGRTLYIDDLVSAADSRKSGWGGALLDWLEAQARALGCAQLHLDSGVQRHDAHRLYLGRKLAITSHHFAKLLD
jgi:GNAT superfamily N-acetyltransferase